MARRRSAIRRELVAPRRCQAYRARVSWALRPRAWDVLQQAIIALAPGEPSCRRR